ncbi:transcriptional regulator, XRE family [Fibrella aestuarina BUZ 2]|uniref:Transcriptional regulator, XRE family n=1 Tax=Fibrella aestuarina BUZ 2 TaxID=1166018 RepID=I0K3K1_9BACT|nr:XRE family transcriptional regulator [Fibrella aestuarina]CCG98704.1 transcriptional regulator, XRE family [Fibrella aestuarina BUZ 2]
MTLKTLKTEQEYDELMAWIDQQFDNKVRPDSPEGEALQVSLLLVKAYEDEHYPILPPDPIDAIRLKMAEKGIRNQDFVGKLGSKSYVSAVLNRRKPMTLHMARFFHKELGIPAATLLM